MRLGVLGAATVTAAGLAVAHAGPGVTAIGPLRRHLLPRLAGLGRPDHVALTFDDGPDPASTPAVLDLLAARGLRATFFLLGSLVDRAPQLTARIAAEGHEVALHGWDHRYAILRTPGDVAADLARAHAAVTHAAGQRPRYYRPPYGVLSAGALRAARRLRLSPVLWTSWGREWLPGATPESVLATVLAGLTGGATILLHDSDAAAPAGSAAAALGALPGLLDECGARGLSVGPLAAHGLGDRAAPGPGRLAPGGQAGVGRRVRS